VFSSIISIVWEEAESLENKVNIGNKVDAFCESIKGSLVL
jgi:hypothetical protein